MSTDSNSTGLNSVTATDTSEKFWRWFAQIAAAVVKSTTYFLPASHPVSDGERAQSALEEAGAIAAATENVVANLTTTTSFTVPAAAGVKVDTDAQTDSAASTVLEQEEIQRRRNLVRTLFNDFWSGAYEKPASFVERLDEAEDYVNERLAETGEFWQLDAKTRVTLGLPPRSHPSNNGKCSAG
jgi:hypothetical protein